MPQIGPAEIIVILLVGMLVFGPKRLPEMGKQIGRGIGEVRKLQHAVKNEIDTALHAHDEAEATAPTPGSQS
jgi:TatA/E family protein of Tat protein translocase